MTTNSFNTMSYVRGIHKLDGIKWVTGLSNFCCFCIEKEKMVVKFNVHSVGETNLWMNKTVVAIRFLRVYYDIGGGTLDIHLLPIERCSIHFLRERNFCWKVSSILGVIKGWPSDGQNPTYKQTVSLHKPKM